MSKPEPDDDLYGDIYNDEFSEFQDDSNDSKQPASAVNDDDDDLIIINESPDPEETKPPVNTSYSAQIAQQFSAYKQTPSQERQPKVNTQPIPTLSATANDGSSTVFGKKPSEMHDSGKLFVGGLSWDTTDEGLRDYFEQFGKVDACTIMRDPSTGTSRGFAFLTFEDASCMDAVLNREHTLDGKAIDPKRAIPREEHLRNTRYFVGGLSHSTTADSMRAFFSQYGKVVDATVMLDRETGRSKGFGFVTFEDAGTGLDQMVVGKGLLTLDEKEIEVKPAQPRSQREQTRNLVNKITNDRSSTSTPDSSHRNNNIPSKPITSLSSAANPAANLNPMAAAAAMMFPRQQMPGAAGMLGMGMANGMGAMNGMNAMQGMMGMNPMMSMGMGMGMGGMAGMGGNMAAMGGGMGMNQLGGMGNAAGGMANAGAGAAGGNVQPGSGGVGMGGNGVGGMPGMNMQAMNPMNNMGMMGGMNMMQNMGAMRMGMMSGGAQGGMMGMPGMSPMGMAGGGMRGMMGMPGMGMGMVGGGGGQGGNFAGKGNMNQGLGPIRMNQGVRKQQQGFHPYSR